MTTAYAKNPLFGEWRNGQFVVADMRMTTGKYIFVDSVTGTDGAGSGGGPSHPVATIDFAMSLCTASQGDIIIVMPTHAETLEGTGDIDCDIAGVTIVGLSSGKGGAVRPTLTFGVADVASSIIINAEGVTIEGLRMVSGINDLAMFVDIQANNFTGKNLYMTTGAATEAECFFRLEDGVGNLWLEDIVALQPTDPAVTTTDPDTGFLYCEDAAHVMINIVTLKGSSRQRLSTTRRPKSPVL